jgi:hypothetical protein
MKQYTLIFCKKIKQDKDGSVACQATTATLFQHMQFHAGP